MTTENEQPKQSIAYKAGLQTRLDGIDLQQSAIRNLLPGCTQYNDFIAGYDSVDAGKAAPKETDD
jgi:hypothetical protein